MVRSCLHLKSAVTALSDDLLLVNPEWIDPAVFDGFTLVEVDPEEPSAANALRLDDRIVVSSAFPRTAERIARRGLRVHAVDASELAKAEGAVTCCSLIVAVRLRSRRSTAYGLLESCRPSGLPGDEIDENDVGRRRASGRSATGSRGLSPERKGEWGKMSAPQMVCHLAESLKMALGDLPVARKQLPIRYPPLKQLIIYVAPFPKSVADGAGTAGAAATRVERRRRRSAGARRSVRRARQRIDAVGRASGVRQAVAARVGRPRLPAHGSSPAAIRRMITMLTRRARRERRA